MKLVFRVNYHTQFGQSLWLKLASTDSRSGVCFEECLPMAWLNDNQWQVELDVRCADGLDLAYHYQLRQEWNDVVLEEWGDDRRVSVDSSGSDLVRMNDDWRSAGTVDYALETKAFRAVLPSRGKMPKPRGSSDGSHSFRLRMAAVPAGLLPCLLGSVPEIGSWGWHHAVCLHELEPDLWGADLDLPTDVGIEYKYGLFDARLKCVVSLEQGENRFLSAAAGVAQRCRTFVHDECYRRDSSTLFHGAGVAIPVFSLRSDQGLGVGEFADLKPFADWSAEVGLKMIQILPINDTTSSHDWTDSYPYSAISVFALHPMYLRVDAMDYKMPAGFAEDLDAAREWLNALEHVDYEEVMKVKSRLLRSVFEVHGKAILRNRAVLEFLEKNRSWLVDYAAFCVLRDRYGSADCTRWEDWAVYDAERVRGMLEPAHPDRAEMMYHVWLQYELDRQLSDAVGHLHSKGICLKGDLPIGIDRQSVDAWATPHLFNMDAQAGAPPDAFAVKGQNWGFPTYNWEVMKSDGYAWWRSRFEQLSRYFDAYRIDHILGFFRIWQIPVDQVEGIMGWFDPAMPVSLEEIRSRGIAFDFNRFCRPYIRDHSLQSLFGEMTGKVREDYLDDCGHGYYQLRDHVATQRRIVDHFAALEASGKEAADKRQRLRDGLLECASEVLFLEVPGSGGTMFHPRCSMQSTRSYQELDGETRWRVEELYIDYFFRRQESFWQARGYEKLPAMRRASPMLLCGEDLGMVPACVPGVLRDLGILSLEIQRMPKSSEVQFADPAWAPYMSVVSPSTHDMPTLRGWWRENPSVTGAFAWQMLGIPFAPAHLDGDTAASIVGQHLRSPAMWAVFPLQDLLAVDESLRHPDPEAERINVPAIMPYYWRYRMHLGVEELAAAEGFNSRLRGMIQGSGR